MYNQPVYSEIHALTPENKKFFVEILPVPCSKKAKRMQLTCMKSDRVLRYLQLLDLKQILYAQS